MKIPMKKAWVAAVGFALAATLAGGVAVAAGADDWYAGGNADVPDHDQTDVALKLYNASGTEVTTGTTTTPLAAFAAAAGAVRTGDTFATLYVYLPQSDTAPGAWPGLQVSGTGQFSGAGAETAPASLSGKPYVATTADGYTLADVQQAFPNDETRASFAGVYELRLRTSSPSAGVSTEYAAAFVKITGTTWKITDAPVLGGDSGVGTTVSATWPAKVTYGKAASVGVQVNAASGSAKPTGTVKLVNGSKTLSTATLSQGAATLSIGKAALAPGSATLQVVYVGVPDAFAGSQSEPKGVSVAKGATGKPTFTVTKAPTATKGGTATVAVPTSSGLAKATGKVVIVLTKGSASQQVTATLKSGKASVKLPKLAKGTWSVTVTYPGDSHYKPSKSKTSTIKV